MCIFDVKSKATASSPIMESVSGVGAVSGGKHSDPVWRVKWLDRGQDHDEPLITISSDGRVVQWSISKGLESSDLMKLKRVNKKQMPISLGAGNTSNGSALTATGRSVANLNSNEASKGAHGPLDQDPFISRISSGFSFDFSSKDHRVYIAGTEDGFIHKCSTSYAEQYLESYEGHLGPVYGLQWSPYRKDMFLSSSGDWTLRMWQEGRDASLLLFNNSSHAVNDVQWCPTNSTVFGDVTAGGRLEVRWDDQSTISLRHLFSISYFDLDGFSHFSFRFGTLSCPR